jgi:hypothetical protein
MARKIFFASLAVTTDLIGRNFSLWANAPASIIRSVGFESLAVNVFKAVSNSRTLSSHFEAISLSESSVTASPLLLEWKSQFEPSRKRGSVIGGKRPWHNSYRRSQSSTERAKMTTAKEDAEQTFKPKPAPTSYEQEQLAMRANFERLKAERLAREAAASK